MPACPGFRRDKKLAEEGVKSGTMGVVSDRRLVHRKDFSQQTLNSSTGVSIHPTLFGKIKVEEL